LLLVGITLSYLPHLLLNAFKLVKDIAHLNIVLGLNLVGESYAQLIHYCFGLGTDLVKQSFHLAIFDVELLLRLGVFLYISLVLLLLL
jgi:hypothetical protein